MTYIENDELEFLVFVLLIFLLFSITLKLFGIEINMNLDNWLQLASIITSIVIATVVLNRQLGKINKQIELQNQQLIMQHFSDYTKRYQEIMLKLPEEINEDDFGLSRLEAEYPDKSKQIKRSLRTYFDLCFEEWTLNKEKLIEPKTWEIWRGGMQTAMSRPVFYELWNEKVRIDTGFGTEFNNFFDELVEQGKETYQNRLKAKESITKSLNS